MAENSKIEWTDHTFNSWTGCTKVSPACDNCYAESWAKRSGTVKWGAGENRRRTTASNWRQPVKWNKQAEIKFNAWKVFKDSNPGLTDEQLIEKGFIKPIRPRVFCASLADVFDNAVPNEWRHDLWELIRSTPYLDWLLVTKRIGNAEAMLPSDFYSRKYPNVWLGITVCNQEEADRDIDKLIRLRPEKQFLSVEPLLGPIDLSKWLDLYEYETGGGFMRRTVGHLFDMLDWVIVGGESGPKARPMRVDWLRNLRDQCQAADVPFLFKQWGEWIPSNQDGCPKSTGGAKYYSPPGGCVMFNVGKKQAGRVLDGRTWDEVPQNNIAETSQ